MSAQTCLSRHTHPSPAAGHESPVVGSSVVVGALVVSGVRMLARGRDDAMTADRGDGQDAGPGA